MAAMDRAVSAIAAAVATSADEQDNHLPIRLVPAQSGFRISHKTQPQRQPRIEREPRYLYSGDHGLPQIVQGERGEAKGREAPGANR